MPSIKTSITNWLHKNKGHRYEFSPRGDFCQNRAQMHNCIFQYPQHSTGFNSSSSLLTDFDHLHNSMASTIVSPNEYQQQKIFHCMSPSSSLSQPLHNNNQFLHLQSHPFQYQQLQQKQPQILQQSQHKQQILQIHQQQQLQLHNQRLHNMDPNFGEQQQIPYQQHMQQQPQQNLQPQQDQQLQQKHYQNQGQNESNQLTLQHPIQHHQKQLLQPSLPRICQEIQQIQQVLSYQPNLSNNPGPPNQLNLQQVQQQHYQYHQQHIQHPQQQQCHHYHQCVSSFSPLISSTKSINKLLPSTNPAPIYSNPQQILEEHQIYKNSSQDPVYCNQDYSMMQLQKDNTYENAKVLRYCVISGQDQAQFPEKKIEIPPYKLPPSYETFLGQKSIDAMEKSNYANISSNSLVSTPIVN